MEHECPRCGAERVLITRDLVHALSCLDCGQTVTWVNPQTTAWLRGEDPSDTAG